MVRLVGLGRIRCDDWMKYVADHSSDWLKPSPTIPASDWVSAQHSSTFLIPDRVSAQHLSNQIAYRFNIVQHFPGRTVASCWRSWGTLVQVRWGRRGEKGEERGEKKRRKEEQKRRKMGKECDEDVVDAKQDNSRGKAKAAGESKNLSEVDGT